jgi:hypothetical protein
VSPSSGPKQVRSINSTLLEASLNYSSTGTSLFTLTAVKNFKSISFTESSSHY